MRRLLSAAGLSLSLAACAHYAPKPIEPTMFPAALDASVLPPGPTAGAWSQPDLLTYALAHSPQVAEAAAKYRTALAAAQAARQAPVSGLTLTGEYSKDAGGSSPWLWSAISDLTLDVGARRSTRLASADLTALQALYDYGEAVWAVRTAVARARADLLKGREEVVRAGRAVDVRRQRSDRMAARVRAGEDDTPTRFLAESERLVAEQRLTDAQGRLAQAQVALAKALGVSTTGAAVVVLAADTPAYDPAVVPQARGEASLSRRDVLRAVADYDLAEQALRLEIARQYPEVRLGPGYTWERGVTKLPFNLALTLPPTDLNKAAIAQAEAKREEAGRSLEAVQANALAAVDQASAALANAQAADARVRTRDLPTAQEAARRSALSMQAGELDRVDQLAAEAVAADAALAELDAQAAVRSAVIDLEDALRRPFDAAEAARLRAAMQGTQP